MNEEKLVWNIQLGHASWRLISKLRRLKHVKVLHDLKYKWDALCEACQKEKLVKTSFKIKKKIVSTSIPLKLLHIDLFGLVDTALINGKKYGLVTVDDFNMWTWVKFLRSKDESYDVFSISANIFKMKYKQLLWKPEVIMAVNLIMNIWFFFCETRGILHDFSWPRTPQQNGIVMTCHLTLFLASFSVIFI